MAHQNIFLILMLYLNYFTFLLYIYIYVEKHEGRRDEHWRRGEFNGLGFLEPSSFTPGRYDTWHRIIGLPTSPTPIDLILQGGVYQRIP